MSQLTVRRTTLHHADGRYLLLTGNLIDTGRADSLGFLHEVNDDPFAAAQRTAERIAGRSAFTQTGLLRIMRGEDLDPAGWLGDVYPVPIRRVATVAVSRRPRPCCARAAWRT